MVLSQKQRAVALTLAAFLMSHGVVAAYAAPASSPRATGRTGYGFLAMLDRSVGLSPEQRDTIRGLLAQQRQAVQSLRSQTDEKIRAALTAEQQKKFDAFLSDQRAARGARSATR